MYAVKFTIKKEAGRLTYQSREMVLGAIRDAPNGNFDFMIKQRPDGYSPTRYKFYFAHIVTAILLTCGDRFKIIDQNGKERHPKTTEEMHEVLKFYYNPVTIVTPKGCFTTGSTTTGLSDRDFINTYTESIMADFSNPPYNVEFLTREEWKEILAGQGSQK